MVTEPEKYEIRHVSGNLLAFYRKFSKNKLDSRRFLAFFAESVYTMQP